MIDFGVYHKILKIGTDTENAVSHISITRTMGYGKEEGQELSGGSKSNSSNEVSRKQNM